MKFNRRKTKGWVSAIAPNRSSPGCTGHFKISGSDYANDKSCGCIIQPQAKFFCPKFVAKYIKQRL